MKFYLSSYKIGNDIEKLNKVLPINKKTAYISNAIDFAKNEKWAKLKSRTLTHFSILTLLLKIPNLIFVYSLTGFPVL